MENSKTEEAKPNVVFVLGGPGAGKGTMCELASLQCGWTHISAGDLLRAERKKGNEQAELINSIIVAGKLVPSDITVGLVHAEMLRVMNEQGKFNFLIDGFPRNQGNLDAWEEVVGNAANVACMLFFECPLPILEQRILGRAEFSGRKDDNVVSLRKRFNTYKDETMPIVNIFRERKQCVEIDSSAKRTVVWEVVKGHLSPYSDPEQAEKPLTEKSECLLGLRKWPKKNKKAKAEKKTEACSLPTNTLWIEVKGSGTAECDGLYCPSTVANKVSESGTPSVAGYWNGKMAWDRVDGKAKRNPSLSYSNSYKSWRIARLDGHLAYTIVTDANLPPTNVAWDVYKKAVGPAPSIVVHKADPRQ